MIRADIAEIEKLTDAVVRAASDADEVRNRLRNLSAEMAVPKFSWLIFPF